MITLWSLYDSVEKIQIDDLKTEQVRIILLSIPTARMKDWMICKKGEIHWECILNTPEFYEDVRDLKGNTQSLKAEDYSPQHKPSPQAPSPRRPLFEDIDLSSEETLALETEGEDFDVKERRSARRFTKRLQFEVIQGGKSFKTETVDVSMAGFRLEDQLPSWAKKQFKAKISLNDHDLQLVVARVEEDRDGKRVKVLDAERWEVLRSWVSGW